LKAMKAAGKTTPRIVMINGSPTDSNSAPYKKGAEQVYKEAGAKIVKSYDTPDWSPDKAQQEMEQTITALGKKGFDAVYVANDGMAGGAIAAMKSAGLEPGSFFVTGQDAEVTGVQRILKGEQLETVYQPLKIIASKSAEIAVPLAQGKPVPSGIAPDKTDNGAGQVPSVLVPTLSVDKSNVNDTVVKDGFLKASDICTSAYKSACTEAGIQ
jgi:D-xylose transport system substrate-binding protein